MDTRATKRTRVARADSVGEAGELVSALAPAPVPAPAQVPENLVSVVSSMLKRITELEQNRGEAFNEKYNALLEEYDALQEKYRTLQESVRVERQRGANSYSVLLKEKDDVFQRLHKLELQVRKADEECCSMSVMVVFYAFFFSGLLYILNSVIAKN
jgi:predicted nuclease with TOPRIM domain